MPDFTPTPEQQTIVKAARETSDNLSVVARAGAAKTSTLILIAEALPEADILCLAFNKAIATEMSERLPPNCEAKTLHSLGSRAWFQFTRKRAVVKKDKVFNLLKHEIENLDSPGDKDEAYEMMAETLDYIRKSKQAGYLPDKYKGHWKSLINDDEFFASLPLEPTPLQQYLIQAVCVESFKSALVGEIDFDDMIMCPAITQSPWPVPSITLVDEAQDLAPINHHILRKVVRNRRLIAVGDPCQAIYGFRGADTQSMTNLARIFNTTQYHLTISFRCASKITLNASWRAPDMKSPEWAEEGVVKTVKTWEPDDLELGDAIICRNNAPLFSLGIKLIEADKLPEIAGRDIAASLKKIMKKLGGKAVKREIAIAALDDWKEKELKRARDGAKNGIHDRYNCIRIFLDKTETLGDAQFYLDSLLNRTGRTHLMTGHKSKGLEFDNVWFLDQHLCNLNYEQDANIKYVIETRAKRKLTYCYSEGFITATEGD